MDGEQSKCLPIEDPACKSSVWIFRTLPTALLAIGTFGNIFNVFVLSRRKLRASPCFLLAFLACFDIILIWSIYLQTPLRLGFDTDLTLMSDTSCKVHFWVAAWSGSSSFWTVAILTVERLLFTTFPHRIKLHLNKNKSIALLVIISLLIGTMLGALIPFIWKDPVLAENGKPYLNESTCLLKKRDSGLGPQPDEIWLLVPCIIIPALIIVTGNLTLSVQLYKRRQAGTPLDAQTTLLLLVSGLLVLTIGLSLVLFLLLQALSERDIISPQIEELLSAVTYPLWMCSFSFNFALYSWKGTLFKRECKALLQEIRELRCRCKTRT